MENGSGALQQTSTGRALWPWEKVINVPEPAPAPTFTPTPSVATGKGKYVRTEAHNKAIRDGWAKRRRRLQAQASASGESLKIDEVIEYHQKAIKTLQAAKALLK